MISLLGLRERKMDGFHMGMNEVADEIISEAEKKAAEIIKSGSEESEKLLDEATKKTAEKKNGMKKKSEEFLAGLHTREMTKARLNIKKSAAETKGRAIEGVYERLFVELLGDREKLLKMLASSCSFSADAVCVNEKDISAAKRIFSAPVKKADIEGGVILEAGGESVDMSISTIKELVKNRTLKDVSSALFGK